MLIANRFESILDSLNSKIPNVVISEKVGISAGTITRFLRNGTEMNFISLYRISELLSEYANEDCSHFLNESCMNLERPGNCKKALEYLAVNGRSPELGRLLDKLKKTTNREILDWTEAYSINLMYLTDVPEDEFLQAVREYKPKHRETRLFKLVLEIYYHFRRKNYTDIFELTKVAKRELEKVEDEFLHDSYECRINLLLGCAYLYHLNKPNEARTLFHKIINTEYSTGVKAGAYYHIGMTFLYKDFNLCMHFIHKHREEMLRFNRIEQINKVDFQDFPFIANVWDKPFTINKKTDLAEVAHYEAKHGNRELAKNILVNLIQEKGGSGFQYYYLALAENDDNLMLKSLTVFLKGGSRFFARLAYEHLQKSPLLKDASKILFEM
ncbi:AimR family lysis-lysogeny pheromone receptor [Priestia taiwanensis]|uniref:Uncharacterized protein n=1 Tax=Priestia taiwanensis TaxID=1347902 RepID=A0A917AVP7_9BACI|nr:AimR family lysis-lysogeny pheromone receptor [Priestia taiwanensis]MBM7364580.1 hypothetical protein [Priestia taiwanensis]GGE80389.1 hypothetical protein GCM10007140_32390 [Priestia taiwanensis]